MIFYGFWVWFWVDFVFGWFWVGFGMGFPMGFELILSCFVLVLSYFWVAVMIVGLCWVGGWKIVFFFFAKLLWPLEREGICVKVLWEHFSLQHFPPDLGGWKLWAQKRKLSPGFFFLPIFLLLPNSGKYCFPPYFPSSVFHPPYFRPNQT